MVYISYKSITRTMPKIHSPRNSRVLEKPLLGKTYRFTNKFGIQENFVESFRPKFE